MRIAGGEHTYPCVPISFIEDTPPSFFLMIEGALIAEEPVFPIPRTDFRVVYLKERRETMTGSF
jgi:hypothetical protein